MKVHSAKNVCSLTLASIALAATGCGRGSNDAFKYRGPTQQPIPPVTQQTEMKIMKEILPSIGRGVNPATGTIVGECITGTAPDANILAKSTATGEFAPDGQIVQASFKEIKSSEQLRKALSVSANGKASWGAAGGSVSASFFQSSEITQHNLNMLMLMTVTNPEVRMHDVRLTPEAAELLRTQGTEAFFRRCGTEAVIGYQTGGEFIATVTISSREARSVSEIRADLSVKGVSFSAGAEFAQSMEKVSGQYETTIDLLMSGGKGERVVFTPGEFKEAMSRFPETVRKHAVPIRQITIPFSSLIQGIDTLSQQKRRTQIDDVAANFDDVHDQIADLRYTLMNDKTLTAQNIATIESDMQALEKDRTLLQIAIDTCENPNNPCALPENLSNTKSEFRARTELSADESCGVDLFKMKQDGAVCGYQAIQNSNVINVTRYVTVQDHRCGVKAYNTLLDKSCGCSNPYGVAWGDSCQRKSCSKPEFGVAEFHKCDVPEVHSETQNTVDMIPNTCRHPDFGVESFKVCRHPIRL